MWNLVYCVIGFVKTELVINPCILLRFGFNYCSKATMQLVNQNKWVYIIDNMNTWLLLKVLWYYLTGFNSLKHILITKLQQNVTTAFFSKCSFKHKDQRFSWRSLTPLGDSFLNRSTDTPWVSTWHPIFNCVGLQHLGVIRPLIGYDNRICSNTYYFGITYLCTHYYLFWLFLRTLSILAASVTWS